MIDRSKIKYKPKMIVVHSPQGGSGKSTVAINTAMFLSRQRSKTLLVDMALYGSVVSQLKMKYKSSHGISGMMHRIELLDEGKISKVQMIEMIQQNVEKVEDFQELDVLYAASPIKMEGISQKHLDLFLETLTQSDYDYIIMDTSSELSVNLIRLLEIAYLILITATQDVNCGWKLLLLKDVLDNMKIPLQRVGLIVNLCSKDSGFYNDEYETEIGFTILAEIKRFDRKYQRYVNQGCKMTQNFNKEVYRAFETLAKSVRQRVEQLEMLWENK